jgi:membrane associated rhomboid family serine protease
MHCYRHPGRETLVRCSSCERPICTDCMVTASVGMRCPECARGGAPRRGGASRGLRIPSGGGTTVTMVLIAVNVLVFLAEILGGGPVGRGTSGDIADAMALSAANVADGEWWRTITYGFAHAGIMHLGFNMLALWILGGPLEEYVGSARMLVIYASSVVWGAVGALALSPDALTVGASGGVFGLMAALLVLSRQRGMDMLFSSVGGLLLVNLAITFLLPGISIGGHLGGLIGGAAAALVLSGFGRGHMAYGRLTPPVVLGCVLLLAGGVAAAVVLAQSAV